MTHDRDAIAAELTDYLGSWGLLDPWSADPRSSTRWAHTDDGELYTADRLEMHSSLITRRLARGPVPSRRGTLGVVITAGPPGAGKSTALAALREFSGFRPIDADDFKDDLLQAERDQGTLDRHLARILGDGRPVSLRELSAYVHAESTTIAGTMRERCLATGENVVIHGTLSSEEHVDDLLSELDSHGYSRIVVLDVEVPCEVAVDRALSRWWDARHTPGLGGRFVPSAVIERHYDSTGSSVSARNSRALMGRAEALGWTVDLRTL